MDFELSADQKMLRDTAATFAKKESPITRFRALREDELGFDRAVWKKMGELGWLGIALPEAAGGLGLSFVDLALVIEQLGVTLVPEPILASVVLAGMTVALAGDDAQKEQILGPMIAGDQTLALAYAERASRYDIQWVETSATKKGDGYTLSGEKVFVLGGHAAETLIVSARTSGKSGDRSGVSLFAVDASAPGVTRKAIKTMDGHRAAMITFHNVEVAASARLGSEGAGADVLDRVMDYAAAAACAEGLGVVRQSLELTMDYLKTRTQFGVKIGSFQALQHRAVDMFVEVETSRSTMILAALGADFADATERQSAISAAKVQLATSGKLVTQQAIQLHGGIGVTEEADIGLYFKRMHVLNSLFGDEEHHLARYASLATFAPEV
jgi:alkylation response protein AidB-like acyl-CoA dehydrogenase